MKRFLCFLLAPFCTSDGKPLPPCKPFCEKMKTDCGNVSTLLTNLNCSKFSTLSAEHLCFGDPLTVIDCVGPHSRPCEGRGCVSLACLQLFVYCNLVYNITSYVCTRCGLEISQRKADWLSSVFRSYTSIRLSDYQRIPYIPQDTRRVSFLSTASPSSVVIVPGLSASLPLTSKCTLY